MRALGAVALKNSVYVLPFTPENLEQFQWLTQQIQADAGEATLVRVERIENTQPADIVRLFQDARAHDYRQLAARYRKLLRGLDRKATGPPAARRGEELGRLGKELARVRAIDFFDAPGHQEVERLRETVAMRLQSPEATAVSGRRGTALAGLRGRRWVTRLRPHVDRVASAWLIRRFIDPEAEFLFAPPDEFPPDAIVFDALGAEFGHEGEDCTFETLIRRAGLRDRRLAQLAEIVHDADLGDEKFHREEARGIDLAIRALLASLPDDHRVLEHGMTLFDGLCATMGSRR